MACLYPRAVIRPSPTRRHHRADVHHAIRAGSRSSPCHAAAELPTAIS